MPLTPNIDRKGQLIRGTGGLLMIIGAIVLIVWTWPPTWWLWLIGVVMVLAGAFGLFEAKNSWCALKAMDMNARK